MASFGAKELVSRDAARDEEAVRNSGCLRLRAWFAMGRRRMGWTLEDTTACSTRAC